MESLTTGQVARKAGVNIHTVRYYERRGLVPAPARSGAGYRQYTEEHVSYVRFIKRAQHLGFTLEEIRTLLNLRADRGRHSEVRRRTGEKIEEIDARIRDLRRIRAVLAELSEACDRRSKTTDCLVLHALEDE